MKSIGILGTGIYLPDPVRENHFWSPETVERWAGRARGLLHWEQHDGEEVTDGTRKILGALAELRDDPFQGAVQRRVIPDGMHAWDMELAAAREAIHRSAVDPGTIDLVLSFTLCPDYPHLPSACVLHERLGLSPRCLATGTDGACNSFLTQLTMAQHAIQSGRVRHALLVQSSAATRLVPPEDWNAPWIGDAATAVVVGQVARGKGILGSAYRTLGAFHQAMLVRTADGRRWEQGRSFFYPGDPRVARRMLLSTADWGKLIVHEALADARCGPQDVDFFASHQATVWFRRISQEHAGLHRARFCDTFSWTASLSAANIPMALARAERDRLLADGDLIATYSGGAGVTIGSIIIRWGC